MDESQRIDRLRERRRRRRQRQVRRRRAVALAVLLGLVAAVVAGIHGFGGSAGKTPTRVAHVEQAPVRRHRALSIHRPAPKEIRGVHVTVALASIRGRLDQYAALPGLNAIELDVKDENGKVGFVRPVVPLARAVGAAAPYYDPKQAVRKLHRRGIYVIGRVVTFEDPVLSVARPALAVHTSDGSVWKNNGGLGWTNPYNRRVWRYDVDVAVAAAKSGFDEIQFDYVRFPSDGDLSLIRYPGPHPQAMTWTIPAFAQYAVSRLHPLGVRVSFDVFGLSATRDLGIGQFPRRLARYADAIYPMVYPSHFNSGEYGLPDPNASPGTTVARALYDFRRAVRGRRTKLVPWLQDFTLGRTYTLDDVRSQIDSARNLGAGGFLLWNPLGEYTPGALTTG